MKFNKLLIALFLVVLMIGSGLSQFGESPPQSSSRSSGKYPGNGGSTSSDNGNHSEMDDSIHAFSGNGRSPTGRSLWKLYQESK